MIAYNSLMTAVDQLGFEQFERQVVQDKLRTIQFKSKKLRNELEDYEISMNVFMKRKRLALEGSPRLKGRSIDPLESLWL